MTLDNQPVQISGTLSWLPIQSGPSFFGFILPMTLFVLLLIVVGVVLLRARARRRSATPQPVGNPAETDTDSAAAHRASPHEAEPEDGGCVTVSVVTGTQEGGTAANPSQARQALLNLSEELAETRQNRSHLN